MRIAQVAPLYESVPPEKYGGTERVVSYLTEELVRRGHDVTLFASGQSRTSARLVACSESALRTDQECHDPLALHLVMLERVMRDRDRFDILHAHVDYLLFPFVRRQSLPHLTTLHGRQDLRDLQPLYHEYSDMNPSTTMADQKGQSLTLEGTPVGFDLATNLNHKIQVTGTIAEGTATTRVEPAPERGAPSMKSFTLRSAKSLSDRCTGHN